MKEYSFQELRAKQVINITEGRNLGHIFDICFTCTGCITGFIVTCKRGFWRNFASGEGMFISWRNVIKIGADIILVELVGACGILSAEDELDCDSN